MKKRLSIFIVIFFFSIISYPSYAEDKIKTDTLISVQRLKELERTAANVQEALNDLMEAKAEVKRLQVQYDSSQKELAKLSADLEKAIEREQAQNSEALKNEIKNLEKQLRADQRTIEDLTKQNQDYVRTVQSLQDEINRQKADYIQQLHMRDDELGKMADIRERYFQELVAYAEDRLLKISFGSIDEKEFQDKYLPVYRKYASSDPSVEKAYNALQQLYEDVQTYHEGRRLIDDEPFDKVRVNNVIGRLQSIQKRVRSEQEPELKQLLAQLGQYEECVWFIKRLISGIEKEFSGESWKLYNLQDYLDKDNDTYGTQDLLASYPWLKGQFDGYINTIKENGVGDNKYRQTIMNLKTK